MLFRMVGLSPFWLLLHVKDPLAATNLILAQKHYSLRFEELREMIVAEETKFKSGIF